MQWLFAGTFAAMLCIVPLFGFLVSRNPVSKILHFAYSFFIGNILIFYLIFELCGSSRFFAIAFFIWLSVFNLFVVSLFWSFMADVFSSASSKRYFGIIASGGSLGALAGPLLANYISIQFSMGTLLLVAALFLIMALICIRGIIKLSDQQNRRNKRMHATPFTFNQVFRGMKNVFTSPYLMGIVIFVLLYTAISTVLYFEQAYIVEETLKQSAQRIRYFSNIDFRVNTFAILGQLFLTAGIIKKTGLSLVLASVPFLMGIGLVILGMHPSLQIIGLLIVVHRAGNFMLLRPGREMLFTVSSFEDKYKSKNFIDTAIYRGGDALVAWLFSSFVAIGWGLGTIAFLAIPLAFLWSIMGYRLGKQQLKKEKVVTLNNEI